VQPDFVLQQRRIEVQRRLERVELRAELLGVRVEQRGVLVQVAQALLVLLDAELEGAGFEGFVAEVFEGRCDGDDFGACPLGFFALLVLGEVFVGVAGLVGCLFGGFGVGLACELAAV
jgi:hypothetical protein